MAYFPENTENWKKIASLIALSAKVYITCHVNPDGDAIGSEIALAEFLHSMGKSARIINHSNTPELYAFLDPEHRIEALPDLQSDSFFSSNGPQKGDVVVFLDLCSYKRAGDVADFLTDNDAEKVIIDHHIPEQIDADIIVVNPDACSTGSLVYDLLCSMAESLVNERIAEALLTAIVTDTGYFSYSNTTSTTHKIAASLYNYGVSAREIREKLEHGQPLCRQKLLGLTLANVRTSTCGKLAYSYITSSMFEDAGANREHTDGIINHIRIIENIKVAILFVQEDGNRYKVSFRSVSEIPVNGVASMFGGGGHKKAAGATLEGSLEEVISRVLDKVTDQISAVSD